MAEALGLLCGANKKALVLLAASNENVEKSVRNLASAKYLRANYLNVRDLLGADTVVLPVAAIDVLASYLG
jgi:large subunit ribosomal protein L4